MKIISILINLLITTCLMGQNISTRISEEVNQLDGVWTIDLRPTPESEAYLIEFILKIEGEKTFSGEFYGSSIEKGRLNSNWEKLYFAFSTQDSSNDYYHSGYLLNNKIYGTTYCPNRDFIAPWTGVKIE